MRTLGSKTTREAYARRTRANQVAMEMAIRSRGVEDPQRLRSQLTAAGLKKLQSGCDDCAREYFRTAQRLGASHEELVAAIDHSRVLDRIQVDRRTLLKFFGLVGGAAALDVLAAGPAAATPVHYWGFDSAAAVTETRSCSNLTLAEHAVAKFGVPNFWGRYFDPAPYPLQSAAPVNVVYETTAPSLGLNDQPAATSSAVTSSPTFSSSP